MKGVFCAACALAILAGCASRPVLPPARGEAGASASAIAGATLAQLGFTHGPAVLTLPGEVVVSDLIDQPNVVTLYATRPDFAHFSQHLRTSLPQAGLRIWRDTPTALLFAGDVWEGVATVSGTTSALTLRRR